MNSARMPSGLASPKRGRPRQFDRAWALERALNLFWRHGYDGVSTAELTHAMRITPPSLYAAFGSKEKLFLEALQFYVSKHAAFISRALEEEPTARAGMARVLMEAARHYAGGGKPPGCLVANGLIACAKQHRGAARAVSERRALSLNLLKSRFDRAVKSGELSAATDTSALASFFAAVVQGMSVQAADGASIKQLEQIGASAMSALPASGRRQ